MNATELPLLAPATEQELVDQVRRAASEGVRVLPIGNGSQVLDGVPDGVGRLLSTRNLTGIVSHEPGDGTLSARAGTSMLELREAARAGGHFLTPDVPLPATRTLGGVLAAGHSGPDRQGFGPARHHVLGMRVLLADGTVARTGGQLVKNVTGFDLHRLYCGSRGTLCIVLEAALRLFPEPQEEVVVSVRAESTLRMHELSRAALDLPVRLVSLNAVRAADHQEWSLHARLFGKRVTVDHERSALAGAWPGCEVVSGAAARRRAGELRDGWTHAPAGNQCLPSQLKELLARLPEQRAAQVQPGIAEIAAEAGIHPSGAAGARDRLCEGPLQLMRSIKEQLDPGSLFPDVDFVL